MKGVYCLVINVRKDLNINIGAFGKIRFKKGIYAYVGSAQNNLEKRVSRHLSRSSKISKKFLGHKKSQSDFFVNKKKFWHIDYLLDNRFAKILKVYYKKAKKSEECKIAKKLSKTEIPIVNFGCSDCDCKSHLFKIKNLRNILNIFWSRCHLWK